MSFQRVWHKQNHPSVPPEIKVQKTTMPEILADAAKQYPKLPAIYYMGRSLSFEEFDGLVNRFANALTGLGLRRGDRMAILLPNIPQVLIANLAVMRLGAIPVMLNPLYTDRELEYQISNSESKMALTLDLVLPKIERIRAATRLKDVIACHINDYLPFPKKQLFPLLKKDMFRKVPSEPGMHEFQSILEKAPATPVKNAARWEDTAVVMYSGGTTGVSKGVVHTHAGLSTNVQQLAAHMYDIEPGDRLLFIFPTFHIAGHFCSHLCLCMKLTNVLIPRPEPPLLADAIRSGKPNFIGAVPTIYTALLREKKFRNSDVSFIKGFFSGAAPLPIEIINQLKELTGSTMLELYGMTEAGIVTGTPWRKPIRVGTVGIPFPSTDMKIVDVDTGTREMAIGESGEICLKGPQVMKEYLNNPDETANVLRDGWMYTGDIGIVDEDGFLSIVDRKKDVIITGGFNVYPKEVDEVLYEHPKILEACTIGVPDDYRGETVKAYVVLKPGETVTAEEVIAFCREKLSPYKVPRQVAFISEMPKSAVGKILRRELRDMEMKRKNNAAKSSETAAA